MSEPINTATNPTTAPGGYTSKPASYSMVPNFNRAGYESANRSDVKPYLLGGIVAFLVFQQVQISHLSQELQQINDSVKSSDVRTRLDATDTKLREIDTR